MMRLRWIFEVRHLQSSKGFEPPHPTHTCENLHLSARLQVFFWNLKQISFFVELLVEISTKLVREFHNKIEIRSSLTLAWNTARHHLSSYLLVYSPSVLVREQKVLEEPSSAGPLGSANCF